MNDNAPARTGKELSVAAQAATAKALVEARFTVALNNRRDPMDARNTLLAACRRPAFAATALYAKPIGAQKMIGLSIRFAEEAIRAWGNVDVQATVVYEDESQRVVRISVVDLERNITFSDDIILQKLVERRQVREGQVVISKRENSTGETVFIIEASEDELSIKVAAAKSKAIRNSGLRLIPGDFLEEARKEIDATRRNNASKDPQAEVKQIADAFAALRIKPSELVKYLGHSLETISPAEIDDLRNVYSALKDGETSWAAALEAQLAGREKDSEGAGGAEVLPKTEPPKTRGRKPAEAPGRVVDVPSEPAGATTQPRPAESQESPSGETVAPAQKPTLPENQAGDSPFADEKQPEPRPAPAKNELADKIRELARDGEITEGEILAACSHAKLAVGTSLDNTPPKVLEMVMKDWKGLVTLIQKSIRKS